MILESPTIFGMKDGRFLGAGEAGSETIVGTQSLMGMIQSAVASAEQAMNVNYGGVTIKAPPHKSKIPTPLLKDQQLCDKIYP